MALLWLTAQVILIPCLHSVFPRQEAQTFLGIDEVQYL